MKIYTKKGDAGETGLFGGDRVPKDALRIRTYGTVDELNSVLGWACAAGAQPLLDRLRRIQSELFQLGAELATQRGKKTKSALLDESEVTALEDEIDAMEAAMKPLQTFILPGGSELSCRLHIARSVSRRAERELVSFHRSEPVRSAVLHYLNRLSDYLFVCARYANHMAGVEDIPWEG